MKMPALCPKIRKGQIWRKRTGQHATLIIIRNRAKDDYWQTVKFENRNICHKINKKDLWRFYELVGSASVSQSHNI